MKKLIKKFRNKVFIWKREWNLFEKKVEKGCWRWRRWNREDLPEIPVHRRRRKRNETR
jgi:hypothetical protein